MGIRLGSIISIRKGKKHPISDTPNNKSKRLLRIVDLRHDNNLVFTNDKNGTEVEPNDIMIAWDGANAGTIGYGKSGFIGSTIARLRFNKQDDFDASYVGSFLKSRFDYLRKTATGATIPHISRPALESIKVPEYIVDDQIRIATLLSRIEALIATRKENLLLLDDFLKSTFLEMFGDPVSNEKGWPSKLLSKCCNDPKDIKCGPFGTQLSKSEYQSSGVPLWGIPQINSNFKIKPTDFLTNEKAQFLDQYSVIVNDIVMSRKGNVGKCALYPESLPPGVMHSDVLRIRPSDKKVNSIFLCYQLRFSRDIERQIKLVSHGAIMAGVNVGKLKSITVLIPNRKLQNTFSLIVNKVESTKRLYQENLTELENLYGALSQKAFKGELDLTRIPLPEMQASAATLDTAEPIKKPADKTRIPYLISTDQEDQKLLCYLFNHYLQRYKGESFTLDDFWHLADHGKENGERLGLEDYELTKQWLYKLIKKGSVKQVFDNEKNKLVLQLNG